MENRPDRRPANPAETKRTIFWQVGPTAANPLTQRTQQTQWTLVWKVGGAEADPADSADSSLQSRRCRPADPADQTQQTILWKVCPTSPKTLELSQ